MPHKEALTVLAAESGTQLDAVAVRAFRRYYSGHRPVALWALLINGPRQLLASLAAEAKLGGAVTAVALATAAAGDVAVNSPQGNARPAVSPAAGVVETFPGATSLAVTGDGKRSSGANQEGNGTPRSGVEGSGGLAADSPQGGAGPDETSTNDSESNAGGGLAGSGDTVSNAGSSVEEVVSEVTTPVNSTVGTVSGKVEPVTKTVESASPVNVTVPEVDVPPVLPKLPGK